MKNQNGITLIALVITIIVLLILAGISIAMLTGDNGLLTKSQTAVMDNAIAGAKDKINLSLQEGIADYLQKYYAETDSTTKATYKAITIVHTKLKTLCGNSLTAGTLDGCNVVFDSETAPTKVTITKDTRKCEGTISATAGTATAVGNYSITWKPIENVTPNNK